MTTRIDWAAEFTFTLGSIDYAYCDSREFAELIAANHASSATVRVVTRTTTISADGRRASTPWIAAQGKTEVTA